MKRVLILNAYHTSSAAEGSFGYCIGSAQTSHVRHVMFAFRCSGQYCLFYYVIYLCFNMAIIRAFDSILERQDEIITYHIVCLQVAIIQCSFQHAGCTSAFRNPPRPNVNARPRPPTPILPWEQ